MSTYDLVIPKQYDNESDRSTVKKIFSLDLEPVKFKMIKAAEEKGEKPRSLSELDVIEIHYKLFLLKKQLEPSKRIAPSFSVDAMWHTHILDTRKYSEDCEVLFGKFLHHNPYFGMDETKSSEELIPAGEDFLNFARQFIPEEYLEKDEFLAATCGPQPTLCEIFSVDPNALDERPKADRSVPLVFNFN